MKTILSINLTAKRKCLGLTQHKASIKLDVKQRTYASWEEGRANPNPQMLAKIAEEFKIEDLKNFILQKNTS